MNLMLDDRACSNLVSGHLSLHNCAPPDIPGTQNYSSQVHHSNPCYDVQQCDSRPSGHANIMSQLAESPTWEHHSIFVHGGTGMSSRLQGNTHWRGLTLHT
jgi:hypothetical protein